MSPLISFFYLCQTNRHEIMELFRNFYHPDHLGSGTWITYIDGEAIQHLHYLPYKKLRFFSSLAFGNTNKFVLLSLPASAGEEQIDQRLTSFNSRYTFSAKEKDIETGYSYFGARYYNSDLSIWLSVDPMSDKYPSMSPYNYCANNPVILVDPNGEDFDPVVDEKAKTITINAVYYAKNDDKEKLQKGVDAWNAQSGKYTYTTGEGDEQKTYSVNFNLTVDPGDYKTAGEAQAAVKQDGKSNYFTVGEPVLEDSRGETHFGNNIKVRNSAPERTVIHELGHTLGVGEGNEEVMVSGGDSGLIIDSNVISVLQRAGISSNTQNCDVNVSEKAQPVRTYNMKGSFNNR